MQVVTEHTTHWLRVLKIVRSGIACLLLLRNLVKWFRTTSPPLFRMVTTRSLACHCYTLAHFYCDVIFHLQASTNHVSPCL